MTRIHCLVPLVLLVGACASAPPAEQYLDLRTGATIFRVDSPLALFRNPPGVSRKRTQFVQFAPIEVNRAGDYRLYLWMAFPDDTARVSVSIVADDATVTLALATTDRRSIGIGDDPYEDFSGLARTAYYHLSGEQLRRIAEAHRFTLDIGDGGVVFESAGDTTEVRNAFLRLRELSR